VVHFLRPRADEMKSKRDGNRKEEEMTRNGGLHPFGRNFWFCHLMLAKQQWRNERGSYSGASSNPQTAS